MNRSSRWHLCYVEMRGRVFLAAVAGTSRRNRGEAQANLRANVGAALMDPEDMLVELERLARRLEVEVRYEPTGGRVGRCLLKGQQVIVVDSRLTVREKVEGLARSLAELDYGDLFVLEAVRELLDRFQ